MINLGKCFGQIWARKGSILASLSEKSFLYGKMGLKVKYQGRGGLVLSLKNKVWSTTKPSGTLFGVCVCVGGYGALMEGWIILHLINIATSMCHLSHFDSLA